MMPQQLLKSTEKLYQEKWQTKYEQLKEFYEEHHHLSIPNDEDNKPLLNWLTRQRYLYRRGDKHILTDERIALLNEIDPDWLTTQYGGIKWLTNYNYCKEFFEKYNTLAIPLHYEPDNYKVGRWLRCQRERYWGKRKPALEQWQIDALNKLNMDWHNPHERWKTYQTSYPEQAIYFYIKQVYSDAKNAYRLGDYEYDIYIPSINTIIEYDGTFHHKDKKKNADNKRNQYCIDNGIKLYRIREKGLNLNIENVVCLLRETNTIDGLESAIKKLATCMNLNMDVDLHRDAIKIVDMYMNVPEIRWMKQFIVVKEYYDKYGTLAGIPNKIGKINVKSFLGRQRRAYKLSGKYPPLSSQKIELLKSVEFEFRAGLPFGIIDATNVERIAKRLNRELVCIDGVYVLATNATKESNDADCKFTKLAKPEDYNKETKWQVSDIIIHEVKRTLAVRKKHKDGSEIRHRSSLSFSVAIGYAQSYYNQHGNLLVPERYEVDGFKLGDWLGWIRKKYYGIQGSPLTYDEISQLESIGMVWNVLLYKWNEKYKIAEQYYKEFGTINISCYAEYNGIKLGRWLHCQREIRRGKRSGNLSQKQIDMLDALGFSWEFHRKIKHVQN